MKRFLLLLPLCFFISVSYSQSFTSIHHEQSKFYSQFGFEDEQAYDSLSGRRPMLTRRANRSSGDSLEFQVYGWHPYWVGTAYADYDYSLLSTLSYFSYELDPATGDYSSVHSWKTTSMIDSAHAAGCRVELCVTNFGGTENTTFLSNPTAWQTFLDSATSLLQLRGGDGINIDFEGIPGSQRNNLTAFMQFLSDSLKARIPGSTVSMAIFSVDWNNVFDVSALDPYVDQFIVMGYGYYYSGSSNAGPNAPLYSGTRWAPYNLTRTTNYYLGEGMTPTKLLIGMPYYGREWKTAGSSIPSSNVGHVGARTYDYVRDNYVNTYTRQWDAHSATPYFSFYDGTDWRQCFYDDEESLGLRYEMVKAKGIGGIGIWALGYDSGHSELWDAIDEHLTEVEEQQGCSGTVYDMGGGPHANYYANEDYTYTISPDSGLIVKLEFTEFELEDVYDFLYLYDGPDVNSPLIGTYTGLNSPGTVYSTGPAITLRFTSDIGIQYAGFAADWQCLMAPDTGTLSTVAHVPDWLTQDTLIDFTENDPNQNGIRHRFYQVVDYNGTEWRGNHQDYGFLYDGFEGGLHNDWRSVSGTWANQNGALFQSDESDGNSSLSIAVNQVDSLSYLYHWRMQMDGSGTNRRAGIHFFCSNDTLPNRGESYFVYFRVDHDKVQIYDVVNDSWTLEADISHTFDAGVWYDLKILYNPDTGLIAVYVDDQYVGEWIDPSPHASGSYVSMRTGNCTVSYDDMSVYSSRDGSVWVTVGDSSSMVRYENQDPLTDAAKVRSVLFDSLMNISGVNEAAISVDWTIPNPVAWIYDGYFTDVDTIPMMGFLEGEWATAYDDESDIAAYEYALGTTTGGDDVVPWTDSGNLLFMYEPNLPLVSGETYYLSVRSQNGAGLWSAVASSDGVTVIAEDSCGRDVYEPNDVFGTAGSLPLIGVVENATICPIGDTDWYSFILQSDKRNIALYLYEKGQDYEMELYNSANLFIAGSYNTADTLESIVISNLFPGQYYVKVTGVEDTWSGEGYNLRLVRRNTTVGLSKEGFEEGLMEEEFVDQIRVYPNPSKGVFHVSLPNDLVDGAEYKVYDLKGEKVWQSQTLPHSLLDLRLYGAGVYMLEIRHKLGVFHHKLFVH